MIDIIIVFTFLAWALLFIAIWSGEKFLGFMTGLLIVILGMFALIYGVQGVNTDLTKIYGLINIGVGIFLVLMAGLEVMYDAENE
ncbi:MAG: hypothetical protein ACP5D2_02390 [Candidatus Nanoarchaeia archaeon]